MFKISNWIQNVGLTIAPPELFLWCLYCSTNSLPLCGFAYKIKFLI